MAHHITHRGNDGQVMFHDDHDACAYYDLLRKYTRQESVTVQAHTLMPNHVHLMLTPSTADGLARVMGLASRCYTQYFNRRYCRTGHAWGGRFFSTVMEGDHKLNTGRYIEQNAGRAGLVEVPWLYKWSSAAAHVGLGDAFDILCEEGWHWDEESWREILGTGVEKMVLTRIRRATQRDIPLVTEPTRAQIEALLGRKLPSW